MKKILIWLSVLVATACVLAGLRAKERILSGVAAALVDRQAEAIQGIARAEQEQAILHKNIAERKHQYTQAVNSCPFSPRLLSWLLASNYSQIPTSLVSELRAALDLPQNLSRDFVLLSKPNLHKLEPPSPGRNDRVSDALSALLSLSPEQKVEIENSLSGSRREFGDWARQNLQRDGAEGETLVKYTIPMAEDVQDSITNRLFARLSAVMGQERSELFCAYADTWFQIENGWLGGVTNTLAVLRRAGSDGQPALFYHLTREGPGSGMGEGPGAIQPDSFPPAWRNVFPGGWLEVAQQEGLELPMQKRAIRTR